MANIMNGKSRRALSGVSLLALALIGTGTAWAQTADEAANETTEVPVPQSEIEPVKAGADGDVIVITGSSIRGVPPTGSNLISVSREDIRTIGANTTPDLLASVPQLNSFNTSPRAANGGAGAFAPGLRLSLIHI